MNLLKFLVLLVAVAVVGCGPSAQLTGSVEEKAPADVVKETLEQIAESGQAGSEIGPMMTALGEMEATDAALAQTLRTDGNALMGMGNPDAVKAKAKEMLAKLGGQAEPE